MRLPKKNSVMVELNDFIHVYDSALEPDICEFLVSLFEQTSEITKDMLMKESQILLSLI